MSLPSGRLQLLAKDFDARLERLNESYDLIMEERRLTLRRMRVLTAEIDMLMLSNLKREQDTTSSSQPQPKS